MARELVGLGTGAWLEEQTRIAGCGLKNILGPLDPDSMHDNSLPVAADLARKFRAELLLLSVIPTFSNLSDEQAAAGSLLPVTTQAFLDLKTENARRDLRMHVGTLRDARLRVVAEATRGDAGSVIIESF